MHFNRKQQKNTFSKVRTLGLFIISEFKKSSLVFENKNLLLARFEPGIFLLIIKNYFRMVDDNKDLKQKLIELDRTLEEKIRQRDAKLEAAQLKM